MASGHIYPKIITEGVDKDDTHVGLYAKATGLFTKIFGEEESKLVTDADFALKLNDSMDTNKLLGRGTGGVGEIEEITLGTGLSLTGTTLNAISVLDNETNKLNAHLSSTGVSFFGGISFTSRIITVLSSEPTLGGTGYSVGDTFNIITGGTLGTGTVTAVNAGVVTSVSLLFGGANYTTGSGKATSTSGNGDNILTVNITTVANASIFNVGEVRGWFIDNTTNTEAPTKEYKIFPAQNGIAITPANLANNNVTYLAINNLGVVQQKVIPFTPLEERVLIKLGVVGHPNRVTILNSNNQPQYILSPILQLRDVTSGLGFFNISGNIFSANGANLFLNKSLGDAIFRLGGNSIVNANNPSIVSIVSRSQSNSPPNGSFRYRLQGGLDVSTTTVIDPNNYDLNNIFTAVPVGRWTIQRISMFPAATGSIIIQPGQAHYPTLADAKAAVESEPFIVESNIAENALLRGVLIVRQGETNLTSSNTVFVAAGKFGSFPGIPGTGTIQKIYNNSTTADKLLTNPTLGAFSVKRGSTADSNNIYEGKNGADDITFAVTGSGIITGIATNVTGLPLGTGVVDTLPIANGGTNNNALPVTAGGIIYSEGDKLVNTGAGASGQILKSVGAGAPVWLTPGAANGVASLDGDGKIPAAQLPAGVQVYKGAWDAADNAPSLTNGTGTVGDTYLVSVAGTKNFGGATDITFAVGDYVIYSGSVWQKIPAVSGNFVELTGSQTAVGAKTWTDLGTFNGGVTAVGAAINLNADSTSNAVNIGTSSNTGTVSIGGTGTQTIAIGNGAGTKITNIGSNTNSSATTILSGTAGTLALNENAGGAITKIGTGTTTGAVTIGNSLNTVTLPLLSVAGVVTNTSSGVLGTIAVLPVVNGGTGNTSGTATTNANLTGHITSTGNAAVLGSFTSAQLATALTDETGSGANVFASSPTLVTPALGTPSALVGTNITGTAASLTAGNVTTNANLTGDVTSSGNATTLATVSSAGTIGGSTAIPVITINAKGLTTGVATAAVIAPAGTLTGATLASGITASSLTSFGTTPTLPTGTIATTQTAGNSTTAVATTAFVTTADNLKANLASPTFTGTVILPSGQALVTPTLGVATATSINKMAITAPATSSTLTVADGKTATINNTLTLSGTDATTMTFPTTTATIARTDAVQTFTGVQTFTAPILGTPTSVTLTNATGLPIAGLTTSTASAIGVGSIELGHVTDTTITRSAAGIIAVEGIVIPSISSTDTLTNKTLATGTIATTQVAGTNTTAVATTAFVTAINNNASYRVIMEAAGSHIAGKVAGTYAVPMGDPLAVSGTGTLYPIKLIYIRGTDYPTINGITTKMRIIGVLSTNDATLGAMKFFPGFYPVTRPATSGAAGLNIYTLGTLVVGSDTPVNNPGSDALVDIVGLDFAIPADGFYCIGVVTDTVIPTGSHIHINAQLQMRNT